MLIQGTSWCKDLGIGRSLSGDVIAETDLNGNTTNEYVFFAGRRISRVDASGNVFFYYADHLGTTRTITTGTGATCYDADFTPYGQEMVHTNTCPQNYKFTGYERDSETGLDYARARFYNPRLGRFMSSDPLGGDLGDPQSQDGYSYVRNSTTGFVDPLGLRLNPAYFADTNPGANINSFTYWGIPVNVLVGTADLYHSDSADFRFEDFSPEELAQFASEGEIELLSSTPIYQTILFDIFASFGGGAGGGGGEGGGEGGGAPQKKTPGQTLVDQQSQEYNACVDATMQTHAAGELVTYLLQNFQKGINPLMAFLAIAAAAGEAEQDCADAHPIARLSKGYKGPPPKDR
jgi:RHS repeat-associated protein